MSIDAGALRDGAEVDAGLPVEAEAPQADAAPVVSPLATRFDGDPAGGTVALVETRCGPGCLRYPKGWMSTDDAGFVYAWYFRGEGAFGTAEVMRCPLTRLDEHTLASRVKYAGGENVTWSEPIDGVVGADHVHALVAEGVGTSHGRKAHFWYAYVDVAKRKDLVVAYVVEGEPLSRAEETIAIVRSVRATDARASPSGG
jgi:hypothetical protein